MKLERDRREFIELLNARDVRYVIVGAFALAHHGRPRYTGDIDFFVEASPENAEKLNQVLEQFGFVNIGVEQEDFTADDQIIQLGVDPHRMDLMTSNPVSHSQKPGILGSTATWMVCKFRISQKNC